MKLKLKTISVSAAADYLDADKHLNMKKAEAAGKKLVAAAERFEKAWGKNDAIAKKVIERIGAKTPNQVNKAMRPVGYYVVNKKVHSKAETYSAAKAKKGEPAYLRKRAFRIMSRKTPTDAYTTIAPIYDVRILGKEAAAIQRDLIKAIETHMGGLDKTKGRATEISQATQAANTVDFRKSADAVVGALLSAPGSKIKQANVFESTPARGVPAVYLSVPGAGVLVIRHATKAQLAAAKKASAPAQ